ncbi:MAG TPA: glycosyltransferase family 4 protein, partial [Caldilineaceae bacterium]|nr:glycosyltransferase family 4 protein [Caldilineaceae bacterium]
MNVENAVEFLGFISDQQRDCFYQIVDAAIFPSLYEPFGLVALEAMALNCNVIASDVGGLGEVVHHQQNGLTVFPDDPVSIAWAVNELFRNPAAAATWRANALNDIHTIYRWETIAWQTAQLY